MRTTTISFEKLNFKKLQRVTTILTLIFILSSVSAIGTVNAAPATIFEDGFESNNLNAWDQAYASSGETIQTVSNNKYSGNYGVQFITNSYSGYDGLHVTKEINAKSELYARAYINVDVSGLDSSSDKLYLIRFTAGSDNVLFVGWKLSGSNIRWQLLIRDGTGYRSTYASSSASTDQWYCVEAYWRQDANNGEATLWINGNEAARITNQDTDNFGGVTRVHFGAAEVYQTDSLVIYGDNFAISDSFIGTSEGSPTQPQNPPPTTEEPEPEPEPEPDNSQSTSNIVSDDFESRSFGLWTGTETTSGETISIETNDPYQGNYHARFSSTGSSRTEEAFLFQNVNEEEAYAKGYFKINQGLPLDDQNDRFYLIEFGANNDEPLVGFGIRRNSNQMVWMAYGRDGNRWIWPSYTQNPTITTNRWYEVEVYWQKDSNQGQVEAYIDGDRIFQIDNINTDNYGNVNVIKMGLIYATSVEDGLTIYGDNFEVTSETTDNSQPPANEPPTNNEPEEEPSSPPTNPPSTPITTSGVYNGLSGYPTSTYQIDQIIDVMDQNGLNIYRMSFNPEWFGSKPHPYRENYIQYFLDNCDYTLIIDRNHIYPPTEDGAQQARNNWNTVRNSLFDILESFPNNQRVMVELINEYVSSDFYSRMQDLVDEIRSAGYNNPIVANKWNQPWTVINDPLDNTYQGYHFYFNSWSLSGAQSQIQTAMSRNIKIINTEVGADYNEYNSFDSSEVSELNQFMEWCTDRGLGNTVWMNENLNNWQRYSQLGLSYP